MAKVMTREIERLTFRLGVRLQNNLDTLTNSSQRTPYVIYTYTFWSQWYRRETGTGTEDVATSEENAAGGATRRGRRPDQ